jgi:hypothetical protein
MRQMKRHFERVIALDAERHEVLGRSAAWLAPLAALALYAWFFFTQIAEARGVVAGASALVAFALVAAWAYAARERIKEIARLPRSIVVRKVRLRMPSNGRQKGAVVARARETFVEGAPRRDVTVFRFVHRGAAERPAVLEGYAAPELRLEFRLDLSAVLPRLDAPLRGLAAPDERTGRIAIVDVPRTYQLPVRATLKIGGRKERIEQVLLSKKSGLERLADR